MSYKTFKYLFYSLCFILLSFNIFGQEPTQEELQKEYGDIQTVPAESISQSTKSDDIIIKNVNQTYYAKTISADGYTKAILTGSVHIVYMEKDIFADEVVIKFLGGKAQVLLARGNVLLKSKDRTTIAREIFVYLETKNVQFLDPITLQNNIYLRGLGLRVNQNDLTLIENISMTTSIHYLPRYTLNAASGWIEKDNDMILLNAYLEIGQDPMIYFPIFYNNHYGTGIITNITYDAYLGFMIYNTFTQKSTVHSEKLMLDYYQKLGFYIGNDYSRTDIGNLQTHIGVAYDYHTQMKGGIVYNVFEQILGEGPSIGRSLRYNFSVDYNKVIFQSPVQDGFNLTYKGNFKELSDPDFTKQFESGRSDQFDLKSLFFNDNNGSSKVQSGSSGTEGRRLDNSITMGFYGYNLQLSSSLTYALNPRNKNEQGINTFSPNYWKNTISQETMPEFSFNKSYEIYKVSHTFEDDSTISIPIKFDINYNFNNIAQYSADGLSNKNANNRLRTVFSSNITYNTGGFFTLSFPLSLEYNYTYDFSQDYINYLQESSLDTSSKKSSNTLTTNYSPVMTFKALENLTITNTTTMKTEFSNKTSNTDTSTAFNPIDTDDQNNYDNLRQTLGETFRTEWVDESWEYLSGYMEGGYTYLFTNKYGSQLKDSSKSKTTQHTGSISTNFFKTTLNVTTSNLYGTGMNRENSLKPVNVSISSTAIPFVTITNNYTWDRALKISDKNNSSLTMSIPSRLNISSWFWFSSVDLSLGLTNDLKNPMQDYLTYRFSLMFNITALWQLEFALSGKNNALFRYGNSASDSQKKNFFMDLVQSFAFWSNPLRQESSFKMENVGLTLRHDLDEWVLIASATLAPKISTKGSLYFDTQFTLSVILKDLGMLSAPNIQQGTDANDYL